ncbi:MAG: diacylglycerol kinase family protein [Patescibacteria group bacterium]|jgi:diacylglycerol kinase family enzyme
MYTYIYDSFVNEKKYQSLLFRIETRLLELGINGRVEKLSLLKSVKEIIADAITRKSETIVLVGNDETIAQAISFLSGIRVVLGIIPIGPHNSIADMLGVPQGAEACDILSRRIVEHIDLGKVNGRHFLSQLEIRDASHVTLDCDGYNITSDGPDSVVQICNFGYAESSFDRIPSDPQDGVLEAVIRTPIKRTLLNTFGHRSMRPSVFPFTKIHIRSKGENVAVIADGQTMLKTPITVEVAPKKLTMIVGKRRAFHA